MPNERINLSLTTSFEGQPAVSAADKLGNAFDVSSDSVARFNHAAEDSNESLLDLAETLGESVKSASLAKINSDKLSESLKTVSENSAAAAKSFMLVQGPLLNVNAASAEYVGNLNIIAAASHTAADSADTFSEIIQKISLVSGRSREDLATFASALIEIGESEQETGRALISASNIAFMSGQDFLKVAEDIFATYRGTTTELDKIGIRAANFTKEQLAAGAAVKAINDSFSDQIEQNRSIAGLIQRIRNTVRIMYRIISDAFAENEESFNAISGFVEDLLVDVGAFAIKLIESDGTIDGIKNAFGEIKSIAGVIAGGLLLIPQSLDLAFTSITNGFDLARDKVGGLFDAIKNRIGLISDEDFLKNSDESAKRIRENFDSIQKAADALKNNPLFNPDPAPAPADSGGDDRAEKFREQVRKQLEEMLAKLSEANNLNPDKKDTKETATATKEVAVASRGFILTLLDLQNSFDNFQEDFAKGNEDLIAGVADVKFPISQLESIQDKATRQGLKEGLTAVGQTFDVALGLQTAAFSKQQEDILKRRNAISEAIQAEIKANGIAQNTLTDNVAKQERQFQSDLLLKQLGIQEKNIDREIAANKENFKESTDDLAMVYQEEIDKLADIAKRRDKMIADQQKADDDQAKADKDDADKRAKAAEDAEAKRQMELVATIAKVSALVSIIADGIKDTSEEDAKAIADINETAAKAAETANENAQKAIASQQKSIETAEETAAKSREDIEKKRNEAIAAAEKTQRETIEKAIASARTSSSSNPEQDIAKARLAFAESVQKAEDAQIKAISAAQEQFQKSEEARDKSLLSAQEKILEIEEMRAKTTLEAEETARTAVQEYQDGVTKASVDAGEQFAEKAISTGIGAAVEHFAPGFGQIVEPLLTLFTGDSEKIEDFIDGLVKGVVIFVDSIAQNAPKIIAALIKSLVKALPELISNATTAVIGAIPVIIDAVVELIPIIIDAAIKFVIEGVPQIIEALLVGIKDAFISVINGIFRLLNNIPFINIPLIATGGSQAPQRAQNTPTATAAGSTLPSVTLEGDTGLSSPTLATLSNTESLNTLAGVIMENSNEVKKNTEKIGFESDVFGVPPELLPGFVSGREAFNPFLDPTLSGDFDRLKTPAQIVIQVGNQRLADLLVDLQESGRLQQVVVN